MYFYMKPGDRYDDYKTNITVKIFDIFGDAATVSFGIKLSMLLAYMCNLILSFLTI